MGMCKKCLSVRMVCGQAFTRYICKECNEEKHYPNTCIPKICRECSITLNQCERCLDKLKGDDK